MAKILVTGGCGFVGSNLVDLLVEENDVYVVDNLITGKKENCNSKAKYIFEDIREVFSGDIPDDLSDVEVVFHLAALARIQPSFNRPVETIDVNVRGTSMVCGFAKKVGAKLVYAGSSSFYAGVYLNPYAFSKWQGEEICKMYSEVFGMNAAIARFFNVYGERQPFEGPYGTVVGIFERQFLAKEPLTITGDGEQRRDFTYVKDICSGLIAMGNGEFSGDVFNLGRGENHSINNLAGFFSNAETVYIAPRPGEARSSLADITKSTSVLGWTPQYDLQGYVSAWMDSSGTGV
jgi:nucleoside-diphosphate-sugar epimerase